MTAFLARLSRSGELQWLRLLGSQESDGASSAVFGRNGDVYLAGWTTGRLAGAANRGQADTTLARYGRVETMKSRLPLLLATGLALAACSDAPPGPDTTPPTIQLAAASTNVTSVGDIQLTAVARDRGGVSRVELYEMTVGEPAAPRKIEEDGSPPYEFRRPVSGPGDNGTYQFTATAYDVAGNPGVSEPVYVLVDIGASAPMSFAVTASHARITTPGRITFTATSSRALVRLEIFEGDRKVGESIGSHSAQMVEVEVARASNGSHTYFAKGYDAGGNVFTSDAGTVLVDIRWEWIRPLPGLGEAWDAAMAMDVSGSLYVMTRQDGEDAVLSKHDGAGSQLWIRRFGGPDREYPSSLGLDASGRVYISGQVYDRPPNPGSNCFLVVYDPAGTIVWAQVFGDATTQEGWCVATSDPSGNFYIAGNQRECNPCSSTSRTMHFLAKYDRDGNKLWTREFGSGRGQVSGAAADPLGGVYVAGYGDADVGTPNRGGSDIFVVKFDAAGNRLWLQEHGTVDHDWTTSVTADPAGGVYVSGSTEPVDFLQGPFGDAAVVRFAADGTVVWSRQLAGAGREHGANVAADRHGVYLIGHGCGGLGIPRELTEPRQAGCNAFLARLATDGTLGSIRLLAGLSFSGSVGRGGIALTGNGDIYVLGGRLVDGAIYAPVLARHREAP